MHVNKMMAAPCSEPFGLPLRTFTRVYKAVQVQAFPYLLDRICPHFLPRTQIQNFLFDVLFLTQNFQSFLFDIQDFCFCICSFFYLKCASPALYMGKSFNGFNSSLSNIIFSKMWDTLSKITPHKIWLGCLFTCLLNFLQHLSPRSVCVCCVHQQPGRY